MALIKCRECGKDVSERVFQCPNCGMPIALLPKDVIIRFPVWKGQMFNNKCFIYNEVDDILAEGRQGGNAKIYL